MPVASATGLFWGVDCEDMAKFAGGYLDPRVKNRVR